MRKIFISSTTGDLDQYRVAARDAVLMAGCQPLMMEYFGAREDQHSLDATMRAVDECDAVVVIVAHRYGWVPPDQPGGADKSITWLTCERARELLAFVVDDNAEWPLKLRESFRLSEAVEAGPLTPEIAEEVQRNVKRLREFKSWLRERVVVGQFSTPEGLAMEVLRALSEASRPGGVTRYLAALREDTAWIDIRGMQVGAGKAHRFPIQDLYIPLATAGAAIENTRRALILGDAGSGKTTLLRRMAYDACAPDAGLFPVLIRVAQLQEHMTYGLARKRPSTPTSAESPDWLAHFLAEQYPDLDAQYFHGKLQEAQTLVLLDGLDELPDAASRERMARLIEHAAARYDACRFLVTSRPDSYRSDTALAGFDQFSIEPLGDEAIADFLRRWAAALYPNDPDAAHGHWQELYSAVLAHPAIRRMAQVPVMLTAIAVMHWNERRLPQQRASLYDALLQWLARSREGPEREQAGRILDLLGRLALAMQTQPHGRILYIAIERAAVLLAPQFRADGGAGALRFLVLETLEGGILVSRGNDVAFWHVTFQEHLAGRALAGLPDHEQHELLLQSSNLYLPEWREMILLYAGLLRSRQGPEKVDALFHWILDSQGATPAEQARCAELLAALVKELQPYGYEPRDARYGPLLDSVRSRLSTNAEGPPEELLTTLEGARRVREIQEQAAVRSADQEKQERALVSEISEIVAAAGHNTQQFVGSDRSIDLVIEFRSEAGEPTELKAYLQLKLENTRPGERRDQRIHTDPEFPLILVWRGEADRLFGAAESTSGLRWPTLGRPFDAGAIRQLRNHVFAQAPAIAVRKIDHARRRGLRTLSLAGLQLATLPGTLWDLTALESLDLSSNALTSAPASMLRLTRLKSLNLARNQLRTLPAAWRRAALDPARSIGTRERKRGLRELYLHENPALGIPREILGPTWEEVQAPRAGRDAAVASSPAAILEYYFSTRGTRGRPLREVKLIVVGRGGAGKTSLIRRLNGLPMRLDESETHGISIGKLALQCSDGPIEARVWDFGGQHILHAMHEFFLTERSVYLLVLSERDDMAERDAAYWLQLIRSYAGIVPVVVALNKSQGRARDLDRETFERSYGPIVGWIPTECDERYERANQSIENLRANITRAVDRMPEVRDLFPASWWRIKEWLEKMPEPYLDFETFQKHCRSYGERDPERQEKLSDRLHDLGIALNYARDPRLRSTTVLRPDWLANGIYALLRANDAHHGATLAPDAVLTEDRVGAIFAKAEQLGMVQSADYPRGKWLFLLRLMCLFQLAYPLDLDGNRLLAPSLLPLEPPPDSEEPSDPKAERLRYEFDVVPGQLIPRFLVRCFSLIDGNRLWRRGGVLRYDQARGRIWSTQDERWIYATVAGPAEDQEVLLAMVRGTLSDLFNEYKYLGVVEYRMFDGNWVPLETLERYALAKIEPVRPALQ